MIGRGPDMELSFWAATDVGKKREINEDNFLVDKKLSLFVVADGMGGHASGEVASKLAVHEFRNAVEAGRDSIDKYAKGDPSVRPQDVLTVLEAAVQTAGQAVYHKGQAEPEKRGMGTTTSALLIAGDRGFIAHVGDSRIYMLRAGQVVQLTEDHSLVNELIRRGRVTRRASRPPLTRRTRTRSRGRSASTRPFRATPSTSSSCPGTSSCSAPTACTPT